jgi:hypothetical protein
MDFYTYIWLREDGSPYYVGKSFHGNPAYPKGERAYRKGCPLRERIRIQNWPDEATAFAFERYQIDFWGRKDLGTGVLRNMTDGGDGITGLKLDPEMVIRRNKAIGDANRGRKPSKSAISRARQATIERWKNRDYRTRMERILASGRNSQEVKNLRAEVMGSTEVRKKLSLAQTPERRAAASKRMKEWATGKQINKGRFLSPGIRAKISETKKRQNLEKKAMAVGA